LPISKFRFSKILGHSDLTGIGCLEPC